MAPVSSSPSTGLSSENQNTRVSGRWGHFPPKPQPVCRPQFLVKVVRTAIRLFHKQWKISLLLLPLRWNPGHSAGGLDFRHQPLQPPFPHLQSRHFSLSCPGFCWETGIIYVRPRQNLQASQPASQSCCASGPRRPFQSWHSSFPNFQGF